MKKKYLKRAGLILTVCLWMSTTVISQVSIGTTNPAAASSMLDIQSTNKGIIIPRMTKTQRDNIATPAEGLQVYNLTNNTSDIFSGGVWKSFAFFEASNLVKVYSLSDLPTPVSNGITLVATKMYVFSGIVDISPNYITMNGAGLSGTDPQKDGVMSSVSGAVVRTVNTSIFMQNFTVVPFGASTKAYDFSDNTGTKFCNIFSGCSVVEIIPSLGIGQISGFEAITCTKNYWKVSDGLKITGNVGKFTALLCFITGISSGSGLDFLAGLVIDDIDLSNNYFNYTGQTGVKVTVGATVDRGRMTNNMFRGVTTPLSGIDSYTAGWSMKQNTNIPDSRAFSFIYFNNNLTSTSLPTQGTFYKIAGTTTAVGQKRFTTSNNRMIYNGVDPIVGKVSVVMSSKAPVNNSNFSIGIAKNGTIITAPVASMAASVKNQSFQITFITEVDLATGDYIEVFITTNNSNSSSILVDELQFRVTD
jgi:hypothetical protein